MSIFVTRASASIAVTGTSAPAGTVTMSRSGWSTSVRLQLLAGNGGRRVAIVTAIPSGTDTVHVGYSGTPRIRASAAGDRMIKVG